MNVTITVTTTTTIAALMEQPWTVTYAPYLTTIIGLLCVYIGQRLARQTSIESSRIQIEERKREKLSEEAYQPLLRQIRLIRNRFDEGKRPNPQVLLEAVDRLLLFQVDEGISRRAKSTYRAIRTCDDLYLHAEDAAKTIINEEVDNLARAGKLNSKQIGQTHSVTYHARIGQVTADEMNLLECVVTGLSPYDVLPARTIIFSERYIGCIVTGEPSSIHGELAKELTAAVMRRAREDTDLKVYRTYVKKVIEQDMEPLDRILQSYT